MITRDMCAGDSDTVHRQITEFYEKVGGFGQLIMVGKAPSSPTTRRFGTSPVPEGGPAAAVEIKPAAVE